MSQSSSFSRRQFLNLSGLAMATGLAGCTSSMNTDRFRYETDPVYRTPEYDNNPEGTLEGRIDDGALPTGLPDISRDYEYAYGEIRDGNYLVPAVPYQQIDPRFLRQQVADPFGEAPGTLIVDTKGRFLYLIEQGGSARRYGVGLGRQGFAWSGRGVIQWKQKWPRWTPPDEMVARQPELQQYSIANGGMGPGLNNPLGARAHYIFQNGEDTLYRVHGSPDWKSIGKAVSSGCVRMINQDVIDLYDRVRTKAPILVV